MAKKKTATTRRGVAGRFKAGTAPGPGRPAKSPQIAVDTLRSLIDAKLDAAAMLMLADKEANREEFYRLLASRYSPDTVQRLRDLDELSDRALSVLTKRLDKELDTP